ncbi:UNVERIFIED_CONTAM: hypothetical protein K2H54_020174 [Gekko kuhli]
MCDSEERTEQQQHLATLSPLSASPKQCFSIRKGLLGFSCIHLKGPPGHLLQTLELLWMPKAEIQKGQHLEYQTTNEYNCGANKQLRVPNRAIFYDSEKGMGEFVEN